MLNLFVVADCKSFLLANLQSRVKKGKMTEDKLGKTMSLLQGSLDYESFRDVDIVIEVVYYYAHNV